MKRKLALVVCALFAFTAAHAVVTLKQGNQSVRYPSKSVVTVKGVADTVVDYDGTEVFVPKGTVLVISPAWNGSVMLTSNSLKGVKVAGLTLDASAPSCVIVNKDSESAVARIGSVRVTDQKGNTVLVNRGQMVSSDKMDKLETAPEVMTSQLAYIGNVLKGEVIAAPELDALQHQIPEEQPVAVQRTAKAAPAKTAEPVVMEDEFADLVTLANHEFEDVKAQQTQRDLEEDALLSPSAPTK